MPKITSFTSKDELKKIAQEDVARISKTIQKDPTGREFTFDFKRNLFASKIEENGKEWIMGIDSSVPGYWHYCPKVIGSSSKGYDLKCNTAHFVFIYQDGEKLTCSKCKSESTIKLIIQKD